MHDLQAGLETASASLAQEQTRAQSLSDELTAARAELAAARAENERQAAELAHVAAARAEMQAAWEKLTKAFQPPAFPA